MAYFSTIIMSPLLAQLTLALATPIQPIARDVDAVGPPSCGTKISYVDHDNVVVPGGKVQFGLSCDATGGDCHIEGGEEISVEVTVSVGAEFGIDTDEVTAVLSTEVSYSTGKATTASVTEDCAAGNYVCGAYWIADLLQVTGTKTTGTNCGSDESHDYTVLFPRLGEDGLPAKTEYKCVCPNLDHADTPFELCPTDC